MGFTVCNRSSVQASVAIMFNKPGTCSGLNSGYEGWMMYGWWNIAPGGCAQVANGDIDSVNSHWYVYAFGDGIRWHGPGNRLAAVPLAAFEQCFGVGVISQNGDGEGVELDFIEINVDGNDDFTFFLNPPA